ncbi:phosphotransferase [Streptomyces sp. NPDC050560]|uniref:phosphotransferase n=1 Tax=Streptomyces sp. NPDC050560 TaxID=3365630 RepID=UPI0037AA9993
MKDAPPDATVPAALPSLACAFGLGEVRGHQYLADGLMNRNWRVETSTGTYAVKQIIDVPLAKVRRNLAALSALADDGLPVPAALSDSGSRHVLEVGGHGFCVLPWIDGSHTQGADLPLGEAHALGALLARLHRSLSRHAPGPVPDRAPSVQVTSATTAAGAADALAARFPEAPAEVFDKEAVEALRERKALLKRYGDRRPADDSPAGAYGWTHGDFQYRNLLRRGGEVVAILDWDRLAIRPYAEEVARTAQVQFGMGGRFSLERVAAFVSGYRSVTALPEEVLADAVNRLWWKRLTDFWQLEFHFTREDPAFGKLFLSDEALLHWWTHRLDEVRDAFAAG